MKPQQRTLIFLSSVLLALAYKLPLWDIALWAPQYPEGLSMQIGATTITGNVDQINILNHYVGMKKIDPTTIPELQIMPYIFAVFAAFGVLTALIGRRWLALVWYTSLCLFLVAGLFDFYQWGYDYGHNLSPDAPIKVPGMTYQPPLVGCKTLLNIEACSRPHWGGYVMILAYALGFVGLTWDRLTRLCGESETFRHLLSKVKMGRIASAFLLFSLLSCTGSSPLRFGHDSCDDCKMLITDQHFGGEIITSKGRTLKFDSIPCLLKHLSQESQNVKSILVIDFLNPGQLIPVEKAHFLVSSEIKGPMGPGPVASLDKQKIESLKEKKSGEIVAWKSVLDSAPLL